MNYEISINSKYEYEINKVLIKEKIFNKELFDYRISDRLEFVNTLIDWISEARESDKNLMKDDLKYLINLSDEYIFSSILTNEYVCKSDNLKEFNKLCFDLLKLNKKVKKCNRLKTLF